MKELDVRKLFGKIEKDNSDLIKHICQLENSLIQAIFIIDAFINEYDSQEHIQERGKKFIAKYEVDGDTGIS